MLLEHLEFHSVSGLSLSKASFSWEILCQVGAFKTRIKLSAKILLPRVFRCIFFHKKVSKKIITRQPLPFKLYFRGTILEIKTLLVSFLLLFTFSKIFIAMFSGSCLDFKLLVLLWMIKQSGLRFSGGLMYVIMSAVADPLKWSTTTFSLLSDNSHPQISLESCLTAVTIWSFLSSCFFLFFLNFPFFPVEIL